MPLENASRNVDGMKVNASLFLGTEDKSEDTLSAFRKYHHTDSADMLTNSTARNAAASLAGSAENKFCHLATCSSGLISHKATTPILGQPAICLVASCGIPIEPDQRSVASTTTRVARGKNCLKKWFNNAVFICSV